MRMHSKTTLCTHHTPDSRRNIDNVYSVAQIYVKFQTCIAHLIKKLALSSKMRWYRAGGALGMRVAKLSARLSGLLPMTFKRASALAISRVTYPDKAAGTGSSGLPARKFLFTTNEINKLQIRGS